MMAYVRVIDFLNKPTLVSPLQFAPLSLPHYPSSLSINVSLSGMFVVVSLFRPQFNTLLLFMMGSAVWGLGWWWVGLGLRWIGRAEDNFTRVMPTRRYSYTHISTIYLSSLPIIDPASHSIQMTVLEQTERYIQHKPPRCRRCRCHQ